MQKYIFVPYSDSYPMLFQQEKNRISKHLTDAVIEHIGSSSVPNLGGKGIIDICIAVPFSENLDSATKVLENIGYEFRKQFSTPSRLYFAAYLNDQRYHIHLTFLGTDTFSNFLGFRDYLRMHPEEAKTYGELKKRAVELANEDGDLYRKYKEPFIKEIEEKLNKNSKDVGIFSEDPVKFEWTEEEFKKFNERSAIEIETAKDFLNGKQEEKNEDAEMDIDDDLKEYDLENYDNNEAEAQDFPLFTQVKGLAFYEDPNEDPYITVKDEADNSDVEDLKILPTDIVLLGSKTDEEMSHLEVYVFEEDSQNLYVHHDIMLPSFALCLEWIGHPFNNQEKSFGNYLAVGTFEPEIEIWNLDVVDSLVPALTLEGVKPLKPSKKSKKPKSSETAHVDAVMSLSWNSNHSQILASSSADKTIKLWDLNEKKVLRSFSIHSDKVQSIQWNKFQSTMMLSGSYDKTVCIFDTRNVNERISMTLSADVECVKWDPFDSNRFLVSLEDGMVYSFDARNHSSPVYSLNAHSKKAVTSLEFNPIIPNVFLTASIDNTVKVWDSSNGNVSCITARDLQVGQVFSAQFSYDCPYLIAAAGNKGSLKLWNLGDNTSVRSIIQSKLQTLNSDIIVPKYNDIQTKIDDDTESQGDMAD